MTCFGKPSEASYALGRCLEAPQFRAYADIATCLRQPLRLRISKAIPRIMGSAIMMTYATAAPRPRFTKIEVCTPKRRLRNALVTAQIQTTARIHINQRTPGGKSHGSTLRSFPAQKV